ncbi:MAG TPA: SGNH/GDSL hydrolase family protein [Stellaceae bacterium]|jgi:lysophospholipase L1-like esterase|nr:SGNH/GDSL hydrolase family protein [Stellaceae bacterium]
MSQNQHWVGTWTASPAQSEAGYGLNNQTIRMNPRVSLGGDTLRVRVSNAYGTRPLALGGGTVGLRGKGPGVVPGSLRELSFNGAVSATIAAGAVLVSDPVRLDIPALADLAVSLYFPGEITPAFAITGRYARQTNYISPPGNVAGETVMPVGKITDEWFFVSGVDVVAAPETGGVVCLGDSLTDANISTHDAFCRWPDQLARRLAERRGRRPMAVMNQGLGGNRILHDLRGDSGLKRFDRDVLAQPGVTHAIVMLGTNDLRNRNAKPEEEVTGEQMIAGLSQMAMRAQAKGIKFIAATLTPFGNETYMANAWNPLRERHRVAVNAWIRESNSLDGVADFDAAIRDAAIPTQMAAIYDCGDGLHPSDLGYNKLGDAIDLALFD